MSIVTPAEMTDEQLRHTLQLKSGASWFYWIAGLSLVNTAITHAGGEVNFLLGLAYTFFIDHFARGMIEAGGNELGLRIVAIGLDLVVAGAFVVFGVLANRGKTWAFVAGIVVYALDALLFAAFEAWPNVAFHALAGFYLVRGLRALGALQRLAPGPAAGAAAGEPPRQNPLVR